MDSYLLSIPLKNYIIGGVDWEMGLIQYNPINGVYYSFYDSYSDPNGVSPNGGK